jgi:hypothetical protein
MLYDQELRPKVLGHRVGAIGPADEAYVIVALVVLALALIVFGLSQAGFVERLRLGDAPTWLGIIVPIGIATGMARIPPAQRASWWLVASGWLVGIAARKLGFEVVSTVSLFAFGLAAITHTFWHRHRIAATQAPLSRRTLWMVAALVVVTTLILMWPHR